MQLLVDNFTPKAAHNVMCKEIISIDWQGNLYDCDFNQVLEIPINYKIIGFFITLRNIEVLL